MTRIWLLVMLVGCAKPAPDTTTPKLNEILARLDTLRDQQRGTQARLQALEERIDELRLSALDLAASLASVRAEMARLATAAASPPPNVSAAPPPAKGRPDPALVYSVPIDGDPVRGKRTAKVTLVMAGEFACPYCVKVRATIEALEQKYGDDLRVVFKNYVVHPQSARTPALAACAAHRQGKFWEMEAHIVANAWDLSSGSPRLKSVALLDRENMKLYARDLGLDVDQLELDMDGGTCQNDLADDHKLLTALGVRGTPSFFVNGRFLVGAMPVDKFELVIDEELTKAKAAIKGGVKAEKYYQNVVVDGGVKRVD